MITDFPLISAGTRFDAVVLANGVFPVHPVPLGILRGAGHVVCCDGAVMNLPFTPTAVIGDGDSLSAEDKLRLKGLFHQVSEQEDNDLTKATRFCLGRVTGAGWPISVPRASGKTIPWATSPFLSVICGRWTCSPP